MNLKAQIHRISCFPYRHFERSEKSSLHSVVSCFFHGKFPLFPLSHIRRYTGVPKRSLGFARDDDAGIALSKHIRCSLREINPSTHRHFERSEKSSLHSALSCFLRRSILVFRYHTYDIIPSCKKDPSTSVGMTIQE